jgi:hypothetical protein
MFRKVLLRLMIGLVLFSAAACYHAPRTAWTPDKYKKRKYTPTKKAY